MSFQNHYRKAPPVRKSEKHSCRRTSRGISRWCNMDDYYRLDVMRMTGEVFSTYYYKGATLSQLMTYIRNVSGIDAFDLFKVGVEDKLNTFDDGLDENYKEILLSKVLDGCINQTLCILPFQDANEEDIDFYDINTIPRSNTEIARDIEADKRLWHRLEYLQNLHKSRYPMYYDYDDLHGVNW